MTMVLECFNCAHYRLDPHQGWNPGKNYPEDRYSFWHLAEYLIETKTIVHPENGWPGTCRRDPSPVPVRSNYRCKDWAVHQENNGWVGPGDSQSFATDQKLTRRIAALEEELKKEKKRSLERFRALHPKRLNGDAVADT